MVSRLLAGTVFVLALSGCFATTGGFESRLESWKGRAVDDLVLAWGTPDGRFASSDGGEVIEFNRGSTEWFAYQNVTGPATPIQMNLSCRTRFKISPQRVVTGWSYEGNNCRA